MTQEKEIKNLFTITLMEEKKKTTTYDASQITVLEGLDPVRKRPGMYIGGTGFDGLHHLIWEVFDNSMDEAMAGFGDHITITLKEDGSVSCSDNGRGIPVDTQKQTGKSALETVLTILHAGGKFGDGGYKVSGGLHGVGVSVVNALSTYLKAEVRRDGKLYMQEYEKGKPKSEIKVVGTSEGTGTTITFIPDNTIFKHTQFSFKAVIDHLRQQAFLTKRVWIQVIDERTSCKEMSPEEYEAKPEDEEAESAEVESETVKTDIAADITEAVKTPVIAEKPGKKSFTFYFEGGISSYAKNIAKSRQPLAEKPFYYEKVIDDVNTEVALVYTSDFKEHVYAFANNIHTSDGGTHLTGFRSALTRVLNDYAKKNNLLKDPLSGEDVREGLTAVISVKLKDPQFEGQTKGKLGNAEVRSIVEAVTAEGLVYYLEENPSEARKIIEKCSLSAKARLAARAARDTIIRKGALEGMTLPGKLADCSSKDPSRSEIYIVEGDSAGGSAKQARDRDFQAILPLRGKILNVERARLDRMLASDEIKALIVAMGAGIGEQIDYNKLRYHRVIIMTDADVDGAHIRTLLLTFFYRNFPKLVEDGHIYIAQPPLYIITHGKDKIPCYNDVEKDAYLKKIGVAGDEVKVESEEADEPDEAAETEESETESETETPDEARPAKGPKYSIQRYKGLGEMNPEQLWQTTMNPEKRVLLQVKIDEAEKADEVFTMLMGDEVPPRKRFIQTHAKAVKNLDV
jgi:DNA gyrase subunit B